MPKVRINKRKEYKEQLRLFITLSNRVRRSIRKHFSEYADLAEALFNDVSQVPDEYYEDYYNDLLTILSASARDVIITMGNRLQRTRIMKKSDEIDPVIIDYVGTQTAQNVRNITETTRKAIQAEISLGLETGLSNPQISKNIRKSTGFSPKRATLIARTETHQAMNYGNQKVAERLGLKKPVKEWASALDERARSWHVNMNGVQVGIDEPFKIMTPVAGGGVVEKQLQYAGDANGGATNVINCRCFVLYYDADDITTGEIGTRPSVIEGDDIVEKPQSTFAGYGETTPEELVWHEASWNDSPLKYKNAISVIPAVGKVMQNRRRGAYANIESGGRNSEIEMGVYKKDDAFGQGTWRHEYGHIIDMTAMKVLRDRDSRLAKPEIKINRREFLSAFYANEIAEDAKNMTKKYKKKRDFNQVISQEHSDDILFNPILRKEDNLKKKEYWEKVMEDGKTFSRKDLEKMLGTPEQLAKKYKKWWDSASGDDVYQLWATSRFFYTMNKRGILATTQKDLAYNQLVSLSQIGRNLNKNDDIGFFADYLGAITTNKIGYGHSNSYYRGETYQPNTFGVDVTINNSTEAFAEFTTLASSKNSEFWLEKMEEFAPKTTKAFDEVFTELNRLSKE